MKSVGLGRLRCSAAGKKRQELRITAPAGMSPAPGIEFLDSADFLPLSDEASTRPSYRRPPIGQPQVTRHSSALSPP